MASNSCDTICGSKRQIDFKPSTNQLSTAEKHSGKYSLKLTPSTQVSIAATIQANQQENPQQFLFTLNGSNSLKNITAINSVLPDFSPIANKAVLVSGWVKEAGDCKCNQYTGNEIVVGLTNTSNQNTTYTFKPKGVIVEGWQRYEDTLYIPANAKSISLTLRATGSSAVYFDDIRFHPFNANMKSFVYHPVNLRLMAEMDENNYATFYEYDDDGTLIRVKKETERGIKTIKETRSALLKLKD
jgi:hypothetical protein